MTLEELKKEKRRIEAEIKKIEGYAITCGRATFKRVNDYNGIDTSYGISYQTNIDELKAYKQKEWDEFMRERGEKTSEIGWQEHSYTIARGLTKEECIHKCEDAINDLIDLLTNLKEEDDNGKNCI